MEIIDLIKTHPLYASLSILLAYSLGYILKISYLQRQNISAAGKNIVIAFQKELDTLIQKDQDSRIILNSNSFTKHEAAIRNNIKSLSAIQRYRLNRAWYKFSYHKNNKSFPFYEMYADFGSTDKRKKLRALAILRIQKIISIVS